ncbi:MAG: glycosyltransferase family 4 protein, partial [Methylomicrobium sp.]|nr:glycosyltransferase family 4 protein [Methylomicrobium sp.]
SGSGEQLNELQNLVKKLGLHDQIVFTGKLNPDQIVQLYHSADILLNPTTVDNMPNSLLEAMACGIPIITTDVGGIPYIVKDKETALFTPVDNPALMATQICKLLASSELYNHLREQGLKEVKQYAWNEVKRQWLSIYSKYRK